MDTATTMSRTAPAVAAHLDTASEQAFQILRFTFVVAPLVAGIDKFFDYLVTWDMYLAPPVTTILGVSAPAFMRAAGVVEILAALLVAVRPQIGGWVVGLWLFGIIGNLLLAGNFLDVALRDLGLALSAIALARLSVDHAHARRLV